MKDKELKSIGKWLNTKGYDLDLSDGFWMEEWIAGEHKFRDIAQLLQDYHTDKIAEPSKDSIIQQVCQEYSQRGKVGLEKYGVTLDREDLTKEQWIQHAKEEAMDLTLYLTKIQKLL